MEDLLARCLDEVQRTGSSVLTLEPGEAEPFRAAVRSLFRRAGMRVRTMVLADGSVLVVDPTFEVTEVALRVVVEAAGLGLTGRQVDAKTLTKEQMRRRVYPLK